MSQDISGVELEVGQKVAYNDPYTHTLKIGKVLRVTPKGATIKPPNDDIKFSTSRRSNQLCVTGAGNL